MRDLLERLHHLRLYAQAADADWADAKGKFRPGDAFTGIGELVFWLKIGGWVYWRGRPKHPDILESQTLRTLRGLVEPGPGQVVKAILIEEEAADPAPEDADAALEPGYPGADGQLEPPEGGGSRADRPLLGYQAPFGTAWPCDHCGEPASEHGCPEVRP